MKITYVKDIDILNLELKKGNFEHSEEVADDVILDLSSEGEILSIEIINASKRLGKDMSKPSANPGGSKAKVKSYVFRVVVEPDEERWHAYCPVLERYGAATWGYTREEALRNIQEVVEMIIEELKEDKEPIPEEPREEVEVFSEPRVAVTV